MARRILHGVPHVLQSEDAMQSPIPAYPEISSINPVETFLNLFLVALILFTLTLTLLPRAWFLAVVQIAFPFLRPP
jgi:hypothetical protein